MTPLTDKTIRFCDEYLIDFNGTRAAIATGYSKKTAAQQASRLLNNVKVQEYLSKKKKAAANKLEATYERTMEEIARIALFDPIGLYDEDGALLPIHSMDANTRAALSTIEVTEEYEGHGEDRKFIGYTKKTKQWSKPWALGVLAEHHGIKKPAPPPVNNFNLNNLTTEQLKALKAIKQKAG